MLGMQRVTQHRLQNFFQRAAATQDSRLHRAHAAIQHFRNFFVAESFEVAQDYRAAEHIGNLLQRALYRALNFVRG